MKVWALHFSLIAALFAAQFLLSSYHTTNLARIMVLVVFAMGYNLAFGYTGLLSLGHALLLGAGMYAAGISAQLWGLAAGPAVIVGTLAGGAMAAAVGLLALRTAG
ncbi:MAG: ABC transporter permease subunit, partial [Paracoccaceae bacterium]